MPRPRSFLTGTAETPAAARFSAPGGGGGGYRGPAAVGGQLSLCSAGDGVLVVDTLGWRFPKGSDNWQHLPKAIGHLSTPAVQCPLLGRNRVWCVDSFVLFSKERLESFSVGVGKYYPFFPLFVFNGKTYYLPHAQERESRVPGTRTNANLSSPFLLGCLRQSPVTSYQK